MAAIFRASEVWRTPTPGETKTIHVTAGVTRVTAVQVTNTTGGEVWLRQGAIAPRTVEDADFVIPPRSTANYPLDSEQISVRWNAQVTDPLDLITFAFTDQEVTPAVYPGVEPIDFPPPAPPVNAPVQTIFLGPTPAPAPLNITTVSGKNVGSVYIHNRSRSRTIFVVDNPAPPTQFFAVEPYSWATLPVNLPAIRMQVIGPIIYRGINGSDSDFVSVSWSDVDYPISFPSGGGLLRGPAPNIGTYESTSFMIDFGSSMDTPLLILPYGDIHSPHWEIINASLTLSVTQSGVLSTAWANIVIPGIVGGPPTHLAMARLSTGTGQGPNSTTVTMANPEIVNQSQTRTVKIIGGASGAGGLYSASGFINAQRLPY